MRANFPSIYWPVETYQVPLEPGSPVGPGRQTLPGIQTISTRRGLPGKDVLDQADAVGPISFSWS